MDEFVDWLAKYSLDPFGQERLDARQEVLIAAVLAPHLRPGFTFPSTRYPYWGDVPEVDKEASLQWYRDYKASLKDKQPEKKDEAPRDGKADIVASDQTLSGR